VAVAALTGCTNDYDEFNVVGEGGALRPDSSQTGGNMTGGSGGEGQGGSGGAGGGTGGDASAEAGRPMPDGAADAEDAHPTTDAPGDAPAVSDVTAEADTAADVARDVTPDVPADRGPDVADATDVVSPPDVHDGGPPSDVTDATFPDVPDVSINDAQDADVSIGQEAGDADASVDAPCGPGTKLCGGTCVLVDDPTHGCASTSCSPCPTAPHTTGAVCGATGACAIAACAPAFADCDGVATNGCEISLMTDADNCGACRRACSPASVASRQCVAGLCVPSCTLNSASCLSPAAPAPDDGCERLVTSSTSCGGCDNNCAAQGTVEGLSCISAVCQCMRNAVCGGLAGACNASNRCVCNGVVCLAGEACVTVGAPADAGADASDVDADDAGADANEDGGVEVEAAALGTDICSCNGGAACAAGQTCCQTPAGCINLATDAMNCGACGRRCAPGLICTAGTCHCATDDNCNAGSAGTCLPAQGQCMCRLGGVCDPGRRCQADGSCG
jgi:hypothetical protein